MRLLNLSGLLLGICLALTACKKEKELADLQTNPNQDLSKPHIEVISLTKLNDCNEAYFSVRVLEENVPDSINYTSVMYEDPFGHRFWTVRTSEVKVASKCNEPSTYYLSLYNRFDKLEGNKMAYTYYP